MAERFDFEKKVSRIEDMRSVSTLDLNLLDDLTMDDSLKVKIRTMVGDTQKCSPLELIRARRQITDYPQGELAARIEDAEPKEWSAQPAFFRAILEKYLKGTNL